MSMDARVHDALTLCIQAVNLDNAIGHHPGSEQRAQVDALAAQVQPLIEALASEPYTGKGLGCGYLGHRGYRTPWADMMNRLRGRGSTQRPLLLDLGMAAGQGPRRQLCRKKIGNASIKRELDG